MTESEMLKAIYDDMQTMKREVESLRIELEAETNRKIQLIADGKFDFRRNPEELLKMENEKEKLLKHADVLENEVRRLKERIINIA